MENLEQLAGDTNTAVTPVAIDFLTMYSDLQYDYKENNISNMITQLQMYQPDDGVIAYENVLRKMQNLLEDYDLKNKQLLLSVIPAPNNMSDHAIKEIFRTITGFVKLDPQKKSKIFQSTFDIKNMDGVMDNISLSKENTFDNASNFKSSFPDTFPFRGFPENEISMIQNNADMANYKLDNNPINKNCLDGNNKYQMSSYQRCLFNKKHCVSTGNSTITSESHRYYPPQVIYQDTCPTKARNNTEVIADLCQNKNLRQFNDIKFEYKKHNRDINTFVRDKKTGISHVIVDIGQNATARQTIKDNINKMDVCWDEDQIVVDADELLATARDKLKTSINNFLKRAQEGISVEMPVFPRTRLYPQVGSSKLAYLTSRDQKPEMPRKVLKRDFMSNVSSGDGNDCLPSKRQDMEINLGKNQRESNEKTEQTAFTRANKSQTQYCSSEGLNKATELRLQKNNLDFIKEKTALKFEYKENDDTDESIFGRTMAGSSKDVNAKNNFQAHSMSQLAAYKKQYYDTLLSVQRAKAAVTNSLASSSDHLTGYDDPYYSNYMCQQQHLYHQQHHFTARPQFSTYPADLSGLSNVNSNQYSWAKSVCKYLLLKQLRLQRQTSPLYARNQDGWFHRYIGSAYPYTFMPNESDQTKHCVRRKSLEDIVGKLKGIERSNVNN